MIVRPLITVWTASISNTRLALLPLTLSRSAPGPTIVTSSVICSSPLVSPIVPLRPR